MSSARETSQIHRQVNDEWLKPVYFDDGIHVKSAERRRRVVFSEETGDSWEALYADVGSWVDAYRYFLQIEVKMRQGVVRQRGLGLVEMEEWDHSIQQLLPPSIEASMRRLSSVSPIEYTDHGSVIFDPKLMRVEYPYVYRFDGQYMFAIKSSTGHVDLLNVPKPPRFYWTFRGIWRRLLKWTGWFR